MNTALFVPCMVQELRPSIAMAALDLLRQAGIAAEPAPNHTCCGQPLYKTGRFARAAEVARHCIDAFARARRLVSPSASCVAMIRAYPGLLRDDPAYMPQAQAMAGGAFELCEFLDAEAPDAVFATFGGAAIHHDSCQSRSLGVSSAVRRCLARVPGLELLELEDPGACCGFGGVFSLQYPEVGEAILEDKLDVIEGLSRQSGARVVVTAEVGCLLNIQSGLQARGSDIEVLHAAEVMAYGGRGHA